MSRQIHLERRVVKALKGYPPKHQKQIKEKILSLKDDPLPQDSKKLANFNVHYRWDCGEYRIIYRYDPVKVHIVLVGKRNGGEVYKALERLL